MRRRILTALALGVALPLVACDRGRPAADEEASPAPALPPGQPGTAEAPPGSSLEPATTTLPSSPLASSPADIQRMPLTEAVALRDSGDAVFIDVRDAESFRAEHVEGAVNLPLGEIAARASELPRDKVIVAYCA
jgi:hypothetical protein